MKIVEYEYSRLCFKADIIEPLNVNEAFIVHTERGIYHYPKTPAKALVFLK